MTKISALSSEEIAQRLFALTGWTVENSKLHKEYKFKDFLEAFKFMTNVAPLAEAQDHHPEWSNVYNRVRIDLVTHEVDGISERDFRLAHSVDELLAE